MDERVVLGVRRDKELMFCWMRIGSTPDFIISFIAIVPLASLLGDATEQCSLKLGQTIVSLGIFDLTGVEC